MTNTVDCPHREFGLRACPGCTAHGLHDLVGLVCCASDGEITGRVIQDSDGDPGVINGIRHFLTVEDLELTCGCALTPAEEQQVTDALCEAYGEDDGLADMYEDEARREAGF